MQEKLLSVGTALVAASPAATAADAESPAATAAAAESLALPAATAQQAGDMAIATFECVSRLGSLCLVSSAFRGPEVCQDVLPTTPPVSVGKYFCIGLWRFSRRQWFHQGVLHIGVARLVLRQCFKEKVSRLLGLPEQARAAHFASWSSCVWRREGALRGQAFPDRQFGNSFFHSPCRQVVWAVFELSRNRLAGQGDFAERSRAQRGWWAVQVSSVVLPHRVRRPAACTTGALGRLRRAAS